MAPNLVASTAVSMVPWPLIMITGMVSWPLAPHSLSSEMPSTSGIQMSSSTSSGFSALAHRAGLRCVLGQLDGVALVGEDLREQRADAEFVVNNKDGGHGSSMRLRRPQAGWGRRSAQRRDWKMITKLARPLNRLRLGRRRRRRLPMRTRAPCSSAIFFTTARPSPVPLLLVVT